MQHTGSACTQAVSSAKHSAGYGKRTQGMDCQCHILWNREAPPQVGQLERSKRHNKPHVKPTLRNLKFMRRGSPAPAQVVHTTSAACSSSRSVAESSPTCSFSSALDPTRSQEMQADHDTQTVQTPKDRCLLEVNTLDVQLRQWEFERTTG